MINLPKLIRELEALRTGMPWPTNPPLFSERVRTIQNVGGYIIRSGRLDAIIHYLKSIDSDGDFANS